MGFLNAIVLLGLLGLAIPVLIHLFARQKLKTIRFSSLEFLKRVQSQKIRRMRFRQILLLVLRSLAVLFMVLAFARPTCMNHGSMRGRSGSSAVLIVDNSMSMGRKDMLEEAIRKADQVLGFMERGDEFCLLTASEPSGEQVDFSVHLSGISTDIQNVEGSDRRGDLLRSLSKACDLLSESRQPNKEIYVISDLQETGFIDEQQESVRFDGPTHVFFLGLEGETQNLAAVEGGLENQIVQPGTPLRIYGLVKNFGSRPANDFLVRVFLQDKPVAQKIVSLEPGASTRLEFLVMPEQSGWISGSIRVEEDLLPADNATYFTVWIPRTIRVGIAGTSPRELDWIRMALDPSGSRSLFELDDVRYGRQRLTGMEEVDVLFLVDYPRFDPDEADRLGRFVEGGGGVVILFGDHVDLRNYNEAFLAPVLGLSTGHVLGGDPMEAGMMTLGPVDVGHPLLEGIFEEGKIAFRSPRFGRYVEIVGNDFQTVFAMSDGKPFLVEKRKEDGGVILFSTGLDPSWSDLPFSTLFAPLIFRSAVVLSAPRQAEREKTIVGSPLTFTRTLDELDSEYTVVTPSEERILIRPDVLGDRMILSYADPEGCGIYRFEQDGRPIGLRAVNPDPRESDLRRSNAKDLAGLFPEGRVFFSQEASVLERDIQRSRRGRELWLEMILLALIVLVTETLVAREGRKHWDGSEV